MTYSQLETALSGLATWLATNFPTYLTRANTGAPLPAAPAINGASFASQVKTDRLPWILVNLDSATREDAGPGYQTTTALVSVLVLISMPTTDQFPRILTRYMDALIDCFGVDASVPGLCTRWSLTGIDKEEDPGGDRSRGYVSTTLEMTIESLAQ